MKLLKTERQLSMYDFRKNGSGFAKILCTVVGDHEESQGVVVELGVGLPDNARQKVYIPYSKNKSLIELIDKSEEVVPGTVLSIEWLKDNADGDGEFEVFLDEERSPKKEVPTE